MNINQLADVLCGLMFDVKVGPGYTKDPPFPDDLLDDKGTTVGSFMEKPEKWWDEAEVTLIAWYCIEGDEGIAGEIVVYGTGPYEILIVDRRHQRHAKIRGTEALEATARKAKEWFMP